MKQSCIETLIKFQTLLTIGKTLDYTQVVIELYDRIKLQLNETQLEIAESLLSDSKVSTNLASMTQMIIDAGNYRASNMLARNEGSNIPAIQFIGTAVNSLFGANNVYI